ncbi:hypothetical protein B0H11DRAFT_1744991, partial [Mycena galericulata]
ILSYPPGQIGAVQLTSKDLIRLKHGDLLNDDIIEFGLKLFLNDIAAVNPQQAQYIHVFQPFFYSKLVGGVRRWTSAFNLFGKRYVLVPINEK